MSETEGEMSGQKKKKKNWRTNESFTPEKIENELKKLNNSQNNNVNSNFSIQSGDNDELKIRETEVSNKILDSLKEKGYVPPNANATDDTNNDPSNPANSEALLTKSKTLSDEDPNETHSDAEISKLNIYGNHSVNKPYGIPNFFTKTKRTGGKRRSRKRNQKKSKKNHKKRNPRKSRRHRR